MKFQYRFESLLRVRENTRDQAAADVQQAAEAIDKIQSQIDNILTQLQDGRRATSQAATSDQLSPDRLLNLGRHTLQLQAEQQALQQTMMQLQAEMQRRQNELAKCESEVKQLRRLRDQKQDQFHAEQLRREQAIIDDQAASRHHRRRTSP